MSIPSPRSDLWVDPVYLAAAVLPLELPLYVSSVSAGFPSPADDELDQKLDLMAYLIKRPAATFMTRVQGDSMIGAGIHPGDLLIVDRSLEPVDGQVVIAALNGELTVKRLVLCGQQAFLQAANPSYPPIPIQAELDLVIWGVVVYAIHKVH